MFCEIVDIDENNKSGLVIPAQYSNAPNASGYVVPALFTHNVKKGAVYSMIPINKDIEGTLYRFQTDAKNRKPIFEPLRG